MNIKLLGLLPLMVATSLTGEAQALLPEQSMHFDRPQTVAAGSLKTGDPDVDAKIAEFFASTLYRLSYNVMWDAYGHHSRLLGGVTRIAQEWEISVGVAGIATRDRPHLFIFEVKIQDYNKRQAVITVNWTITDVESATTVSGTIGLGRVSYFEPGRLSPMPPKQETPPPSIQFKVPSRTGSTQTYRSYRTYTSGCVTGDRYVVTSQHSVPFSISIPGGGPPHPGAKHER